MATEYCKNFASVDSKVTLTTKSLVKMTDEEFNKLVKAKKFGLEDLYTRDDYIYLTDENGKDANFRGFGNNINKNTSAPYKVCTAHTHASWEQYKASHPLAGLFGR